MSLLSLERFHRASQRPSEYRNMDSSTKNFYPFLLLGHEIHSVERGVAFCTGWSVGCMHGCGFALAKTLEETGFERFQMYLKLMAENSGQEIHTSIVRLACRGSILCFHLFRQSFQIWPGSIKGAHSAIHNAWQPNSEPARCRPCFGAAHRHLQAGLRNSKGRWAAL